MKLSLTLLLSSLSLTCLLSSCDDDPTPGRPPREGLGTPENTQNPRDSVEKTPEAARQDRFDGATGEVPGSPSTKQP